MAGPRMPMPCLNSCLEIIMFRGGLQSFLLSKPLLALRFQSYQYDKGKNLSPLWWHFNKILSSCQVCLHQLTEWLLSGKPYLNLDISSLHYGENTHAGCPCPYSWCPGRSSLPLVLCRGLARETPGIALSIDGCQSWGQGKLINFLLSESRSWDQWALILSWSIHIPPTPTTSIIHWYTPAFGLTRSGLC